MSMIDVYCVDPITIVRHVGYDAWNQPIVDSGSASGSASISASGSAAIVIKAWVQWKINLVRDSKGEEVTSSIMVYIPKKVERAEYLGRELTLEDRIIIGAATFDRAIIAILKPKSFSRPYYEVYLA